MSADPRLEDRVLALAGMVQALAQVRRIAETGEVEAPSLETAIDSIFRIDAASPGAVYGGAHALRPGMRELVRYFGGGGQDPALARLAFTVLQLERRFVAEATAAQRVREGILRLAPEATRQGSTHPEILAALGALYSDTVSHLRPRVMVQGNPHYLGQANVVAEIRAVLLAALRSAVLWRQLGGSLWDFLFLRGRMASIARAQTGGG
ncbi:high frequency lysogenization protein HflD [Luteimonas pelagia]